jgi:outer membrane receptor protein involved in Fe transport
MKMIETSATVRRAYFKTMLATGIAFGALLSSPAFAQSNTNSAAPAADEREGLDTIIVTATKRAENLQDVPVSISAIGSEQLASRGVTTSNDLGQVVPNLQVSSQYGETSPNFSLRGVGHQSASMLTKSARPSVIPTACRSTILTGLRFCAGRKAPCLAAIPLAVRSTSSRVSQSWVRQMAL